MKSFMTFLIDESRDPLAPIDETEGIHLDITDDLLNKSNIIAYNVGLTLPDNDKHGKEVPVNPKRFPTKAVEIIIPIETANVKLTFDPTEKKWDSDVKYSDGHVKLSPDQMGQFFKSNFYDRLLTKFKKNWPLSDKFYGELYDGLCEREMKIGPSKKLNEDNDKSMSNKDVTGDGKRDYTASGRKIVKFTDANVSTLGAVFYCWPDLKKLDKWSTWKDWHKIKPLCRMRFMYNGIPFGLSISTLGEDSDYKHRGFRGYDLDPELPPVQWLTHEENERVMKLSIVDKFISHCIKKIETYTNKDPEEIVRKVNDPEKLSIDEVKLTLSKIKNTLQVVKDKQIDDFKWRK